METTEKTILTITKTNLMPHTNGKIKDLRNYAVFGTFSPKGGGDHLAYVVLQVTQDEVAAFCIGLETTVGTIEDYDPETGEPYSNPEITYFYEEIQPLLGVGMLFQKVEQLAEAKRVKEATNG